MEAQATKLVSNEVQTFEVVGLSWEEARGELQLTLSDDDELEAPEMYGAAWDGGVTGTKTEGSHQKLARNARLPLPRMPTDGV